MLIDSGLQSLALVAQFHQVAVDPSALQHRFGQAGAKCGIDELIRAAKSIGFRARRISVQALASVSKVLPAIARGADGSYFVLAGIRESAAGDICCLVQNPAEHRPRQLNAREFGAVFSGELVLVAPLNAAVSGPLAAFNLNLFMA